MPTTRPYRQKLLCELVTAEIFVVSSLRLWMQLQRDGSSPVPHWRQGFLRAEISLSGAVGFDTLCLVMITAAPQDPDIRDLHCPHLTEDEGRLLELISSIQRGRIADAELILGRWCPRAVVRQAIPAAQAFATALGLRQLWLPDQHRSLAGIRAFARSTPPSHRPWIH